MSSGVIDAEHRRLFFDRLTAMSSQFRYEAEANYATGFQARRRLLEQLRDMLTRVVQGEWGNYAEPRRLFLDSLTAMSSQFRYKAEVNYPTGLLARRQTAGTIAGRADAGRSCRVG